MGAGAIGEVRDIGGSGGEPDGLTLGEPCIVFGRDLGVERLLLRAGEFHGPVGQRIVSDLEFGALGLAVLRAAGGEAGVVVDRELEEIPGLLDLRGREGAHGVGVPVVSHRVDAAAEADDGGGPRQHQRGVTVGEAGQQGAGGAGALVLIFDGEPIEPGDEFVAEEIEAEAAIVAFAGGLGQRTVKIVGLKRGGRIKIARFIVIERERLEKLGGHFVADPLGEAPAFQRTESRTDGLSVTGEFVPTVPAVHYEIVVGLTVTSVENLHGGERGRDDGTIDAVDRAGGRATGAIGVVPETDGGHEALAQERALQGEGAALNLALAGEAAVVGEARGLGDLGFLEGAGVVIIDIDVLAVRPVPTPVAVVAGRLGDGGLRIAGFGEVVVAGERRAGPEGGAGHGEIGHVAEFAVGVAVHEPETPTLDLADHALLGPEAKQTVFAEEAEQAGAFRKIEIIREHRPVIVVGLGLEERVGRRVGYIDLAEIRVGLAVGQPGVGVDGERRAGELGNRVVLGRVDVLAEPAGAEEQLGKNLLLDLKIVVRGLEAAEVGLVDVVLAPVVDGGVGHAGELVAAVGEGAAADVGGGNRQIGRGGPLAIKDGVARVLRHPAERGGSRRSRRWGGLGGCVEDGLALEEIHHVTGIDPLERAGDIVESDARHIKRRSHGGEGRGVGRDLGVVAGRQGGEGVRTEGLAAIEPGHGAGDRIIGGASGPQPGGHEITRRNRVGAVGVIEEAFGEAANDGLLERLVGDGAILTAGEIGRRLPLELLVVVKKSGVDRQFVVQDRAVERERRAVRTVVIGAQHDLVGVTIEHGLRARLVHDARRTTETGKNRIRAAGDFDRLGVVGIEGDAVVGGEIIDRRIGRAETAHAVGLGVGGGATVVAERVAGVGVLGRATIGDRGREAARALGVRLVTEHVVDIERRGIIHLLLGHHGDRSRQIGEI